MSKDITYIEDIAERQEISKKYLEQIIPGYRTSETTGRWNLYSTLKETTKLGDYSRVNSKRYESRDFVVSYYLTCDTPQNLHDASRKLKGFLHQKRKEFKVIFKDEPEIFYVGIVDGIEAERLVNSCSVTGRFKIHCADGRGYSVKEYEVSPTAIDGAYVFNIDYNGTTDAYPILEVKTRNTAGTGFVGFLTSEGSIIQIGDPTATQNVGNSVINKSFENADVTGWVRNGYTPAADGTNRTFTSTGIVKASGVGLTINSAGTGSNNHGPCLSYDFSSNSAQNFSAEFLYVLNMNSGSTDVGGGLEFIIVGHDSGSATDYEIARISIYKKDNKTSAAKIDCWVDGKIVDSKEFKMDDPSSNLYTGSSINISN